MEGMRERGEWEGERRVGMRERREGGRRRREREGRDEKTSEGMSLFFYYS